MKTLFEFWDVNLFADKSSCATDPICKMLHLMGLLLHFHLRPSSPRQILSKRYSIFVPILINILPIIPKGKNYGNFFMCVLTRDGRGMFFFMAGRSGTHTAYITWLKSYATSEEALICIALSESEIYSTLMIIIFMIIIILQCCHSVSLRIS